MDEAFESGDNGHIEEEFGDTAIFLETTKPTRLKTPWIKAEEKNRRNSAQQGLSSGVSLTKPFSRVLSHLCLYDVLRRSPLHE